MAEPKQLIERSAVPTDLTWNLKLIYEDQAAIDSDLAAIKSQMAAMPALAKQPIATGNDLLKALEGVLKLDRVMTKFAVYTELLSDQDTSNAANQGLNDQASALSAQVSSATAWLEPAVVALKPESLKEMYHETPALKAYQHLIDQLQLQRGHVLQPNEEALLASASDIFDASEKTFGLLNDSDFKFPVVTGNDGQKVRLSQGVYGVLLQSPKRSVRKEAFQGLYQVYDQFKNTLASTLTSQIKVDNFNAQVHHYSDARSAAMANNQIPSQVYDGLVTSVNQHLPLLQRYLSLRQQTLKVPELHMYDLYTPLTGQPKLQLTYQDAQDVALKALSVLGSEYQEHVKAAFNSRWIDVVENRGKRSGAYSSGMYDTAPYILLNWQDNLDSLYTLVHEMGHSMHSYFTTHNQPYQYGDYAIFVAEIASTTNENLLTDYLLAHETDPAVRAYVLNYYLDGFKGTVFRQTQFAEFEQWLHEQSAAGKALTADTISQYYGQLNAHYYGKGVVSDPEISLEWSRIPHFYYDYYVYQYATGFAAASTLAERITSKQPAAVDAYLNYLKAGSSDYPINVMQRAGVDMTQEAYLDQAFTTFADRLSELETLLPKLAQ